MKDCPHCRWWRDPNRPPETFRRMFAEWDVDAARLLVAEGIEAGRYTREFPTSRLSRLVSYPTDDGVPLLTGVPVCAEHLDHVDTAEPIIGGLVRFSAGAAAVFQVIDGHHRIARAVRDGVPSLMLYLLTEREMDSIYCGDRYRRPARPAPLRRERPAAALVKGTKRK